MKSRQAQAKDDQGWRKDGPKCGNCCAFRSTEVSTMSEFYGEIIKETNLRCNLGGFKVGKSNWCDQHTFEEDV